jgi:hypothetical protein
MYRYKYEKSQEKRQRMPVIPVPIQAQTSPVVIDLSVVVVIRRYVVAYIIKTRVSYEECVSYVQHKMSLSSVRHFNRWS